MSDIYFNPLFAILFIVIFLNAFTKGYTAGIETKMILESEEKILNNINQMDKKLDILLNK